MAQRTAYPIEDICWALMIDDCQSLLFSKLRTSPLPIFVETQKLTRPLDFLSPMTNLNQEPQTRVRFPNAPFAPSPMSII